jgi:membrane protease YdiL (CAAX protease family)
LQTQTEDLSTQNDTQSDPSLPTNHSAVEPPSKLRRVFIGSDGLRAGWSILIFIALFAAIMFCVNAIGHKLHHASPNTGNTDHSLTLKFMLINESIPFAVIALLTWVMSRIERRPNSVYGLGGNYRLPHFLTGLAAGVTCLSLLVLTLWKAGFLVIDSRLLFGSAILRYGALWLFGFLMVAFLEEYLTRGYLQYTLTRGLAGFYRWAFKTRHSQTLGFWTSAIFFSILFGLGHSANASESPIGLFTAGLAAMVFCFSLWRTGSLWWAIGFHTAWDWAQSFLYGVADSGIMVRQHLLATHPLGRPLLSGGDTGPEGSIFILPIVLIIVLIIIMTVPHTANRDTPEYSAQV